MKMSPHDPLRTEQRANQASPANAKLGLLILAFSLLAAAAYFFYDMSEQNNTETDARLQTDLTVSETATAQLTPSAPAPQILAIPLIANKLAITDAPKPALPAYENSNDFIKEQLGLAHWQALNVNAKDLPLLDNAFLLQQGIAFLDALSRGNVPDKLLPFARPKTAFIADKQGEALSMGPKNFQRYDRFTKNISNIDTAKAAEFFHWTRPLLETAYGELGYPPENLSGALISAIDILLATPDIESPIALKRESVLFQYADPKIEALGKAQKQLIRMGPKNSALIKRWLTDLRHALLSKH